TVPLLHQLAGAASHRAAAEEAGDAGRLQQPSGDRRGSIVAEASRMPGSDIPAGVETRTIRKDWIRILPLIFILYVVAFIDRINIGFAALTMNRELSIN